MQWESDWCLKLPLKLYFPEVFTQCTSSVKKLMAYQTLTALLSSNLNWWRIWATPPKMSMLCWKVFAFFILPLFFMETSSSRIETIAKMIASLISSLYLLWVFPEGLGSNFLIQVYVWIKRLSRKDMTCLSHFSLLWVFELWPYYSIRQKKIILSFILYCFDLY